MPKDWLIQRYFPENKYRVIEVTDAKRMTYIKHTGWIKSKDATDEHDQGVREIINKNPWLNQDESNEPDDRKLVRICKYSDISPSIMTIPK